MGKQHTGGKPLFSRLGANHYRVGAIFERVAVVSAEDLGVCQLQITGDHLVVDAERIESTLNERRRIGRRHG